MHGFALAFGGLASAILVAPTFAQTTPVSPPTAEQIAQTQQKERVEITGSLLRRANTETALPITTLNMDDLKKAGVTTAEQAVSFISENQSATTTTQSVGQSNGAASYADLRGFGPARTLVLLNGQRIVKNPYSGIAVDLNTIPLVAVERVEVLRDGASAIYGTDAIAGVINIITRKEFTGVTMSAQASVPQGNGGETYSANITGGYGNLATQGWNAYVGFSYQKQEELLAVDRGYAASGLNLPKGLAKTSGTTFPANYSQSSTAISTNPTLPGCRPTQSVAVPALFGVNTCRFDFTQFIQIFPEQEQWSVFGRATFALGKNNTLAFEAFQSSNTVSTQVAPTPLTGLSMGPGSPYYPGNGLTPITRPGLNLAAPISVGWRMIPAGTRDQEIENVTNRFMAQFEGSAEGWNYNVNALYSGAEIEQSFTNGYVSAPRIRAGVSGCLVPLVAGLCPAGQSSGTFLNPFGPNNAAQTAYITSAKILGTVQNIEGNMWGINATVSKDEIFRLPAGPVSMAIGASYEHEEIDYRNNFVLIRQAASSGLELAEDTSGDRDVSALMLEFNIPIVKNLDLGIAVRYDDYSDVGSTTNPKISLRWQAQPDLLLRGSWMKGFRAPSLFDVYAPNSITFTSNAYDDPVLCPGGVPVAGADAARDCGQQFQAQQGGSKTVQPEESTSWSVGFVWDVTSNFSFGLDYWNTEITNQIGALPETAIFGAPSAYANKFVRCSQLTPAQRIALVSTCGGQNAVDPLAFIVTTTENLGDLKASGIDVNVTYRYNAGDMGRFTLNWNGSYLTKWESQLIKNGDFYDANGNYSAELNFPAFRWQHVLQLGWQYNAYSVNLFNRYRSKYSDQNDVSAVIDDAYAQNTVGAYSIWDLTGTWTGIKGLSVTAGVQNLFNTPPPFSNQGATFQTNFDPRFTNPLDRRYLLRVGYSFM